VDLQQAEEWAAEPVVLALVAGVWPVQVLVVEAGEWAEG
jgi:hypothetical protein